MGAEGGPEMTQFGPGKIVCIENANAVGRRKKCLHGCSSRQRSTCRILNARAQISNGPQRKQDCAGEPTQSYPADHHAVSHGVSRHSCVSRPNRLILLANEAPQLADAIRLVSSHVRQTDQAPAGKNQSCLVWGRRGGPEMTQFGPGKIVCIENANAVGRRKKCLHDAPAVNGAPAKF